MSVFLYRLSLILVLTAFFSGCSLRKSFQPMTSNQITSGEQNRAGSAAMERGDWELAEKKFEEAVKLSKKDAELRRHYAEALWVQGKHRESFEQLSEAAKWNAKSDGSLEISFAEKYLLMDDLQAAYQYADRAVRYNPKEFKAWALRGKATWYLAEQQVGSISVGELTKAFDQARNDYYRALSLSPNNRDVLPELAALQMRRNEPEYALATWQNLQDLYQPGSEPMIVLQGKADAYLAMNRFADAADCLLAAERRTPNDPNIVRKLQNLEAAKESNTKR